MSLYNHSPLPRFSTIERRRAIYRNALLVIDECYAEELTVEELARMVFTSARQLQRCFADVGATTVRRAILERRMERAAELLLSGVEVREAAAHVGYRSHAQFTRAFRRRYGRVPSSIRGARRKAGALTRHPRASTVPGRESTFPAEAAG